METALVAGGRGRVSRQRAADAGGSRTSSVTGGKSTASDGARDSTKTYRLLNVLVERVLGSLKREGRSEQRGATHATVKAATMKYLEMFDHRRHFTLGFLSFNDFESRAGLDERGSCTGKGADTGVWDKGRSLRRAR